jgi:hypothetical protein
VLWLTVVVALVCAWITSNWLSSKRLHESQREALNYKNVLANERNYREQLEDGTPPPADASNLSTGP